MRPVDCVNYLVYVVVRVLICIVQAIRLETGVQAAWFLAWLFGDLLPHPARKPPPLVRRKLWKRVGEVLVDHFAPDLQQILFHP